VGTLSVRPFLLYGQPILLIHQHLTRCSATDEGLVSGNNFTPYTLHIGQLVHLLAGRWVKVPVDAVHLVVHLTGFRLGFDGVEDSGPVGIRPGEADGTRGQERIPVARPYGLLREILWPARDVRNDLSL
jgi:hypothetical protein